MADPTQVELSCPFWGPLLTGALIGAVAVAVLDKTLPSDQELDERESRARRGLSTRANGAHPRKPRRGMLARAQAAGL